MRRRAGIERQLEGLRAAVAELLVGRQPVPQLVYLEWDEEEPDIDQPTILMRKPSPAEIAKLDEQVQERQQMEGSKR